MRTSVDNVVAMPMMKLFAQPDNYKTQKALIAAKYVGLDIETPSGGGTGESGRIPVLQTDQGCIFSSTAIARYIARISRPVGLYGQNLLEGGMVDSWMEFCTHELEVPLCAWVLPVMGAYEENPQVTPHAKKDVEKALTVLNNHLLHYTYMVGHTITLADISIFCALVDGMKLVLDDDFRKPFGNLMRWFNLCLAQPEFAAVVGQVKMCGGAQGGKAAPKQEGNKQDAKPKQEPKQKPEPKAKQEPKAKKEAAPKKEGGKDKKKKEKEEEEVEVQKTPEELEKERKDKLKKAIKEGGKRGVEIEGAADMGGLQFFCTSVDVPQGDLDMLVESMKAMNEEADPTQEERKGGSGNIGKMIFSAGTEQLAVVAYVPASKEKELSAQDWLESVLGNFGGVVQTKGKQISSGFVKTDGNKNVFPLKIREPMILEANNYLRKKGLFPEDDSDDDEMVFGDDDFPSM